MSAQVERIREHLTQVQHCSMDAEYFYDEDVSALLNEVERLESLALSLIPDKVAHRKCSADDCAYRRALDSLPVVAEPA